MIINGQEVKLTKHTGRLTNTGTRVVVVFREIPGDPNHCLVVEADHLPDMYADNINSIVKSTQAQDTVNLYEVLDRRTFSDGANCLQTLHGMKYLKKIPVEMVEMLPLPGQAVPLATINDQINGVDQEQIVEPVTEVPNEAVLQLTPEQLLLQAKDLEERAASLREEAYVLDPSMRPGKGRPKLTAQEKQQRKEERNAKRREAYKAKKESTKQSTES